MVYETSLDKVDAIIPSSSALLFVQRLNESLSFGSIIVHGSSSQDDSFLDTVRQLTFL